MLNLPFFRESDQNLNKFLLKVLVYFYTAWLFFAIKEEKCAILKKSSDLRFRQIKKNLSLQRSKSNIQQKQNPK